jgi:predicted ABC-type ATPase
MLEKVAGRKMKKAPNIYIVAGPNGVGKTTFMEEFLPNYADCLHFVNADLIAAGLSPFSPESAAIKAGKLMLEEIERHIDYGHDFAFETTLAGKNYVRLLKKVREKGYKIHLFFLWMPNVDLAIKRIEMRVKAGGHNVPTVDVKRRFYRGIYNLFNLYRPLLDFWMLFDNSSTMPQELAFEKDGILTVINVPLFEIIERSSRLCQQEKK